nr:YceI family protein [Allomuricauda sp.]|tara:strand:- start:907 stop:1479 length:573 start_codon:yes stop_codon:yes gene_type:complete
MMMKKAPRALFTALFVLSGLCIYNTHAQDRYIDKNGTVIFEASEKFFEEVKAKNESVTAIFDETTNDIASLALIKGFRFKNSLMQEHFNENYVDSDTYPKATFKGKLINTNPDGLSEKITDVTVEGILELNGKQKEMTANLKGQKVGNTISLTGSFIVSPEDFNITIPKIVRNKIAKQVTVKVDFKLVKK